MMIEETNGADYDHVEFLERYGRAKKLQKRFKIRKDNSYWIVPSQTLPTVDYIVDMENHQCSCPDFKKRRKLCKHILAVDMELSEIRMKG